MFYDSQRIVTKNENYEKTRAYNIVSDFRAKNLSTEDSLSMIDILLKDNPNESKTSILNRARTILLLDMELDYGKNQEIIKNSSKSCCDHDDSDVSSGIITRK